MPYLSKQQLYNLREDKIYPNNNREIDATMLGEFQDSFIGSIWNYVDTRNLEDLQNVQLTISPTDGSLYALRRDGTSWKLEPTVGAGSSLPFTYDSSNNYWVFTERLHIDDYLSATGDITAYGDYGSMDDFWENLGLYVDGSTIVWTNNTLTSIAAGGEVDYAYVDGSLARRDSSLNVLWSWNSEQDASLNNVVDITGLYALKTELHNHSNKSILDGISSELVSNWNTAYTERRQWNGGSSNLVASTARTSLGLGTAALVSQTTLGGAFMTIPNPSAIRYVRINSGNGVDLRTADNMRGDLGLGNSATLNASTIGAAYITASNPNAITYVRANANNTITFRSAADYRIDLDVGGLQTVNTWTANNRFLRLSVNTAIDTGYSLKVNGAVQVGNTQSTGWIRADGEITGYYTSDSRLKEEVETLTAGDILDRIRPVSYKWNSIAREIMPYKDDRANFGVIADELQEVLPELVHDMYGGDYKGVDYVQLIPILIASIQELRREIKNLKNE
jgi:hypothetical protein